MAGDSPLIAALQSEWGNENSLAYQTVTVKNVMSQVSMWLDGAAVPHLVSFLGQMLHKLQQAELDTQHDLKEKDLSEELAELIRASLQDYVDMAELLEELIHGVENLDGDLVANSLSELSKAAMALVAHQVAIQEWLDEPVLRCPRCGLQGTRGAPQARSASRSRGAPARGGDSTCPKCDLEMLYQDPKGPGATRTLTLTREYKVVHDVYVAIIKGEMTLSRIYPNMEPLRELLQSSVDLAQAQLTYDEELSRALDSVALAAQGGLEGISIIEGVRASRQTRELHDGWRRIFECAAAMQGEVTTLAKAAGQEVEEITLQTRTEDAVFLTGDDD